MTKFGVALLAILAVNSAFGANWILMSKEFYKSINSLDIQSISVPQSTNTKTQTITYFIKDKFPKPLKSSNGKYHDYSVTQYRGDCKKNKYTIVGWIDYAKNALIRDSYTAPTTSNENWYLAYPKTLEQTYTKPNN